MSLTSSFFTDNRRRFADKLPDNTVVYLFAGEAKRMCGDTDYRFLPDRNFYYMTGLSRAGLILVIEKKAGVTKDILYAPAHDKIAERWGGKRPDFEKLTAISGIEDIRNDEQFDEEAMAEAKDGNTGLAVDGSSIMEAPRTFTEKITTFGVKPANIAPIITDLRLIKNEDELDCIRKAAKITEEAIAELKPYVKPGVTEYELYTRLEFEMARRGSLINAFEEKDDFAQIMSGEPNAMSDIYGQAVALRATCYWELFRWYGDVPHALKTGEAAEGLTSRFAIMDSHIQKLREVEPHMYRVGEGNHRADVMNRTYVQGLIGRMCLYNGGYTIGGSHILSHT